MKEPLSLRPKLTIKEAAASTRARADVKLYYYCNLLSSTFCVLYNARLIKYDETHSQSVSQSSPSGRSVEPGISIVQHRAGRASVSKILQHRFVKPDSNFSINHAASLRPRTLLPPTARSSRRCEVRFSRMARFSLVNLYPVREVGGWISREAAAARALLSRSLANAKRRAAAEAAVVGLSSPPVPFFLCRLPPPPPPCALSLGSPLMVFSLPTPSYLHVAARPRMYARSSIRTTTRLPQRDALSVFHAAAKRERFRSARLYASATLNHSLEITYVRIDSYYYKAYVGRACVRARCVRARARSLSEDLTGIRVPYRVRDRLA